VGAVSALVMLEGLPGSGKSTTAHSLAAWLADRRVAAEHWGEGRIDHPVDFEQVAVLSREDLRAFVAEHLSLGLDHGARRATLPESQPVA
jgi:tRNA uridine 5-carbamoylmethylation protein Kti12